MRLFVAVNLPVVERNRLGAVLDELRRLPSAVRWVDTASLHLTLKFLGEVAAHRVGDLTAAMDRAVLHTAPFDITIGDLGAFPNRGRPRVFWIGVQAPAALSQLHTQLEQQFVALGFPREARAFSPHITLGRVPLAARAPEHSDVDRIAAAAGYNGLVHVTSIELMRSHLGRAGARYEAIERSMFGSSGG